MAEMKESLSRLSFIPKAILNTYSIILFSESWLIGLLLLLSTFLSPIVGLSGFLGLIIALIAARTLGFESWNSKSGVLAFNSLLTCLGIGYYFPLVLYGYDILFLLIFIGSLFSLFLYIALDNLVYTRLKIPSMSLSFSIVSIFMWLFLLRLGNFQHLPHNQLDIINYIPALPKFITTYFQSIGGIFLQPHVLAGICIALALFLTSRIGFLLSLVGYTVGYFFLKYWGVSGTNDILFPGFNLILVAYAIGGIYIVPGRLAYFMAIIASFIGIVITFAFQSIFRDFLIPPFALPFNITVYFIIYALHLRLKNRHPYVNDFHILHPEKALEYYMSSINRFARSGVPQFYLPFAGEWTVTQGNHGDITHRSDWAYAWDFEIMDKSAKNYHHHSDEVDDYYCYGKAVFSSAAGYVAKIMDGIPDNRINQINTEQRWGNYISIHHGYGLYTLYAHLKAGSIKLKVGDYVPQGEKIALVGNSGRSAVPHLHFHVQSLPEPGSKTIFSNIANYKRREKDGHSSFSSFGIPLKGEPITPLTPVSNLQEIMNLLLYQQTAFDVRSGSQSYVETWTVDVSLTGVFTILSDRKCSLDFSVYNGIFNALTYRGKRDSALFAFAVLLSRYPFVEEQSLEWKDTPSFSVILRPITKQVVLLFASIANPVSFITRSISHASESKYEIETHAELRIFRKATRKYRGRIQLERNLGIEQIEMLLNESESITAKRKMDI